MFSFDSSSTIPPRRSTTVTSSRRRRPASAKLPSRSTARATASCRRSSASSTCCPSTGGKAPTRTARSAISRRPRSSRRSAAAPTGSRSSRPAAPSSMSACKDYWGKDLNVNVGRDNFDEMRYEYFRDATVALEAFKGDRSTGASRTARRTGRPPTTFPAVKDKRVLLEEFPIAAAAAMQAFVFNIRRDKFKDPRVRLAFNYAFDFEEMNKQIFFGQYKRIDELFRRHRACLVAACRKARNSRSSRPCATRCRRRCSPSRTPIRSAARRERARQHARSAAAAQGGRLRSARPASSSTRRPASRSRSSSCVDDPNFERFVLFYKPSLERLGIDVTRAHRRRRAIREPAAQLGLRHHHRCLGRVALARQRAARLLGLAGGRPARARATTSASRIRRSTR